MKSFFFSKTHVFILAIDRVNTDLAENLSERYMTNIENLTIATMKEKETNGRIMNKSVGDKVEEVQIVDKTKKKIVLSNFEGR